MNHKRIAVVGIGGVGGYLAGMLGAAYPGEITFVARGEKKEQLKENGLQLHSDMHGEIHAVPKTVVSADELEEQDYIFLCVKNYSLEEACAQIAHAVGEHTVIIPVMNGVDPGARVRETIGKGIVVESLIYIVAYANADGSIAHVGNYARLRIGIMHANESERQAVAAVSEILTTAGIEYLAVEDIELEIWRKYILNCAYNVATAAYDNTIGELRDDADKAAEYEALVKEAYEVAKAKGVAVRPEHADEIIERFYNDYPPESTSSLQRDLRDGKRAEIDIFSGYLVREAGKLEIAAPVSEKMYELLQKRARM